MKPMNKNTFYLNEREFYFVRIYIRKGGWRFTLLETMNFETNQDWAFLRFSWDKKDGVELSSGRE